MGPVSGRVLGSIVLVWTAASCAIGDTPTSSVTLGGPPLGTAGDVSDGGADDDADDGSASWSPSTGGDADGTSGADTTSASASGSDDQPCVDQFWYLDSDGDGHGDPESPTLACDVPPNHVDSLDDCDDLDANNAPSLTEECDGQDNDCDGQIDEPSDRNAQCNGCTPAVDGDHTYFFCPDPADFEAARTACMVFGADLVTIDDAAELDFIVATDVPPTNGVGGYFIGLNDRQTEGQYVWADGAAAVFTNYNDGEPNDAGGAEDCTEMSVDIGIWNDVSCDGRAFICEAVPA